MNKLLKTYHFNETEKKWQNFWMKEGIYKWQDNVNRENTFSVDTPPPTISGDLHIGHIYSYTQADFIIRFQRMKGKNVFYPMGFDNNGLPTERLVEKKHNIKACSSNYENFINACNSVITVEVQEFRNIFNKIGLSTDWSLEYQTIDTRSKVISQMSFLDLVSKKEVYRNTTPIFWDTIDQTALSQAEIEDKKIPSFMNYIKFVDEAGTTFPIMTTRPEMLPACVAVFFHPDDNRYKHLEKKYLITPIIKNKVPVIQDSAVKSDKGTGLVMCCTFGDQLDVLWWKKHRLPYKNIISKEGHIILDNCIQKGWEDISKKMNGLPINEARKVIIQCLKELGYLIKQIEIIHNVKCAERSGNPIEIITTPQWFINTIKHRDSILEMIKQLNWYPKYMRSRLERWVEDIAWDWCISRQRYFGVHFPVWYSKKPHEKGRIIFAEVDQLPVNPSKDLPIGYSKDEVEPEMDVMDTWATSSVSSQINSLSVTDKLGINTSFYNKIFPFDLRYQAHEIINTWTFYSILKSYLHKNIIPWKNIMVSGWCLAQDHSKMSKSKGNIILPNTLIKEYGADAIRYWAANSRLGSDTIYSEEVIKRGVRLLNKIWNAAKLIEIYSDNLFLTKQRICLEDFIDKVFNTLDIWIIVKVQQLVKTIENCMFDYEYSLALNSLEQFFWYTFCDNYLEIVKIRAYNKNEDDALGQLSAIISMCYSFELLIKLFSPFLPFISEEIYQNLYRNRLSKDLISIHSKGSWPKLVNLRLNELDLLESEFLIEILGYIRKCKSEKNLSIKAPIDLIEIKDLVLKKDLILDLRNVTSCNKIISVKEFSTKGEIIKSNKIEINILFP